MKTLALLVLIVMTSCGKSEAQNNMIPVCTFGPVYGECKVTNNLDHGAKCELHSKAITAHGAFIVSHQYQFLYPGMSLWSWARAFDPWNDPIVKMDGTALCK